MSEQESMIDKIRKLLAKAESTDFGPEAEALYAKAQELMLRHAIDEEIIRKAKPRDQQAKPIIEVFQYSDTSRMRMAKAKLLNSVARNNRCRVILMERQEGQPQKVWIAGFADDIGFVKVLFASLSITVLKEGSRKFKESGSTSQSNFIRNFYDGFTLAIDKRLREENEKTTKAVGESRALVVLDRKHEVDAAVAAYFGRLGKAGNTGRGRAGDQAAHGAGFQSGMTANIRPGQGHLGGSGQKLIRG
jgi:hypothetical protein